MSGETFKKAAELSNPLGQINYAYRQVTGDDVAPRIKYKGAQMSLTGNTAFDAAAAAKTHETGRQNEKAAEKLEENLKSDEEQFRKFKAQETSLLEGKSSDLFVPQYKTGKRQSETDALAKIFQARKNEVAQRKAAPGISQTRFGAL